VEVLFYAAREAMRNAARYGRGARSNQPLQLQISICDENGLVVKVRDDGVGLTQVNENLQGSQQGLEIHRTMLAVVGGTLDVSSSPGQYTQVTLRLPVHEGVATVSPTAK
jgi:signal transduction histidine kinase